MLPLATATLVLGLTGGFHVATLPGGTPRARASAASSFRSGLGGTAFPSAPGVLQAQYEQGRGDPAVDMRVDQERERMERKLTALDREINRLIDADQAEVLELSELSERRRGVEEQGRMLRKRLREIEQQRANRENEL